MERDEEVLAEVRLARRDDPARLAQDLARGQVDRVRWGAYLPVIPSQGVARDVRRRVLGRIAAVHEHLQVPHWFSHESAAVLRGWATYRLADEVHLLQESRPTRRGRDPVFRHHGPVPDDQRAVVHGIPVTSPERTLLDCASSLPTDRALVVADSALRAGADRGTVGDLVAARGRRRGTARARVVLDLADGRSESPGETLVRLALHEHDVPAPEPQVEVPTRRGRFRVDLAWRSRRLALEFDGFVKYSGAFGATAVAAVFAEKQRQDALEDAGWRVLRVTWDDLRAPADLAARVSRALSLPVHAPVEVEPLPRGRGFRAQ